jgi:hypothetical protein
MSLLLLHVVELLLVLLKLMLVELLLLLLVLLLQLLLLLLVVLLKLLQVARVLLLLLLLMLLELLLLVELLLVELLLLLQMKLLLLLKLALLRSTAGSLRGRLLLLPRGGLAHRRRRAELWRVAGRGTAAGSRTASTGARVGRSRWPRLLLGPLGSRAVAAQRHAHREVLILLIILRFGRPIALKSGSCTAYVRRQFSCCPPPKLKLTSRPLACWLLL